MLADNFPQKYYFIYNFQISLTEVAIANISRSFVSLVRQARALLAAVGNGWICSRWQWLQFCWLGNHWGKSSCCEQLYHINFWVIHNDTNFSIDRHIDNDCVLFNYSRCQRMQVSAYARDHLVNANAELALRRQKINQFWKLKFQSGYIDNKV